MRPRRKNLPKKRDLHELTAVLIAPDGTTVLACPYSSTCIALITSNPRRLGIISDKRKNKLIIVSNMTKQWDMHEATIKQLYAENTLAVVRQMMIDRYGFKAS